MRYDEARILIYKDNETKVMKGLPCCLIFDQYPFDSSLYLAGVYTSMRTGEHFWEIAIYEMSKMINSEGAIILPAVQINKKKIGTFGDCAPGDAMLFRIRISEKSYFYEKIDEKGYHYFSSLIEPCNKPVVEENVLRIPWDIRDIIEPIIHKITNR